MAEAAAGDIESDIRAYFASAGALVAAAEKLDEALALRLGQRFNVFDMAEIGENHLSRILRDFLDPRGSHGQGARFLEAFLKMCGIEAAWAGALETIRVETEVATSERRRIDIVIWLSDGRAIGIENKPWAQEGENQLDHYAGELQRWTEGCFYLVYLCGYEGTPVSLTRWSHLRESGRFVEIPMNRSGDEARSLRGWAETCARRAEADKLRWVLRDFAAWLGREFPEVGKQEADDGDNR